MSHADTILNALLVGQSDVTLYGKFSQQDLHDIFDDAWNRVPDDAYPEGVEWNASFDDKHVEFHINYRGQRPKNNGPIPQNPPQNPPKPESNPVPKPTQPEPQQPQPQPKQGGLRGLWNRLMGGGSNNQNNPKPKPKPNQPHPEKPKPTQSNQHIPLEDLEKPLPSDPEHVENFLCTSADSTYIDRVNVDVAASFMLDCMNNHKHAQAIIQSELQDYTIRSEGACSLSVNARTRGPCCTFFIDFNLGMKNVVFYDHLGKGRRAAKTTMYRLTHNGNFPDMMKVYLAYAFFQKEVTYNNEYLMKRSSLPDGNNHMAYGPLVQKKGVCEGYSWALVHLLASANIPATLCYGKIAGRGDHAWVKVELNGKIYNVDPTIQPSSDGSVSVMRFLKSDQFLKEHGYTENNPVYQANDDLYDDAYDVIEELNRYREAAIRAGADKNILMSKITGGN